MTIKPYALMFAGTICLTACMSTGTYVDETQTTQFKQGETTIQQVENIFGPPTMRTINANGDITIAYNYMETKARPASFIPFVGPFVGGADSKMTVAQFTFDQQGVLINKAYTDSQSGTNMNFTSGTASK